MKQLNIFGTVDEVQGKSLVTKHVIVEGWEPVTVWKRFEDGGWKHNHYNEGWSQDLAPTPKFPGQNVWSKMKWKNVPAALINNEIIPVDPNYINK